SLLIAIVSMFVIACSDTRGLPPRVESQRQGTTNVLSMDPIGSFHFTPNEVRNLNAYRVPESNVLVSTWEEQGEGGRWMPWYGISLKGRQMAAVRQTSYELLLRTGNIDPAASAGALAALPAPPTEVQIVQFNTQILPEYRSQLEAAGARIYRFLA